MICLTYANDITLRRNGSSGGFIRASLIYLIENKLIDQAIIATTDGKEPHCIATNDINHLTSRKIGSIYYPVNPFIPIKDHLIYAITLLPCQVEILRKLQEAGKCLNIKYVFELLCAFTPKKEYLAYLKDLIGIKEVDEFYFRGNGWPGDITAIQNNKEISIKRPFITPLIKTYACERCKGCRRTYGKSDFTVGDPWGIDGVGLGKSVVKSNNDELLLKINNITIEPLEEKYFKNKSKEIYERKVANL